MKCRQTLTVLRVETLEEALECQEEKEEEVEETEDEGAINHEKVLCICRDQNILSHSPLLSDMSVHLE